MAEAQGFKHLSSLIRDDSGQATVEYILILSMTVVATTALARTILSSLDRGILNLGSQLEKDLKTGRTPINVWQN